MAHRQRSRQAQTRGTRVRTVHDTFHQGMSPIQQPAMLVVKNSLTAHADDTLMIAGHPVVTDDGTHVLLAQRCGSMRQEREKKQAQQQQ